MARVISAILMLYLGTGALAAEDGAGESGAPLEATALTVTVTGAQPLVGQMMVSLFNSKKTFLKTPVATQNLPVGNDGRAVFVFEGLAPGEYAASAIWDEDMDGELDTGFLGIPKEKVGFSNNAKGSMGPAPYKKAKFMFGPEATAIQIDLVKVN